MSCQESVGLISLSFWAMSAAMRTKFPAHEMTHGLWISVAGECSTTGLIVVVDLTI